MTVYNIFSKNTKLCKSKENNPTSLKEMFQSWSLKEKIIMVLFCICFLTYCGKACAGVKENEAKTNATPKPTAHVGSVKFHLQK